MTRPPVTQCGYPVAPKHEPHCTGRRRLVEGCWCFMRLSDPNGPRKLTARQWRAARRRAVREDRIWRRTYGHLIRDFEDRLIVQELNRRAQHAMALRSQVRPT